MAHLIDKDALVAEINRILSAFENSDVPVDRLRASILIRLLSFIDTLKVKEANNVWHDAIELPDETSLILLLLKDGNFILADEKTAYIRELIDKWCYVSDI